MAKPEWGAQPLSGMRATRKKTMTKKKKSLCSSDRHKVSLTVWKDKITLFHI